MYRCTKDAFTKHRYSFSYTYSFRYINTATDTYIWQLMQLDGYRYTSRYIDTVTSTKIHLQIHRYSYRYVAVATNAFGAFAAFAARTNAASDLQIA